MLLKGCSLSQKSHSLEGQVGKALYPPLLTSPTFIPIHRQNTGDPKNKLAELENSPNLTWISPMRL